MFLNRLRICPSIAILRLIRFDSVRAVPCCASLITVSGSILGLCPFVWSAISNGMIFCNGRRIVVFFPWLECVTSSASRYLPSLPTIIFCTRPMRQFWCGIGVSSLIRTTSFHRSEGFSSLRFQYCYQVYVCPAWGFSYSYLRKIISLSGGLYWFSKWGSRNVNKENGTVPIVFKQTFYYLHFT